MCGHLLQGGGNETHRKWWLTLSFAKPELPGSCTPKGRALWSSLQEQYLIHSGPQAAFETRDTALEELGSSREKSHRSKLSVVYNRVSVEELPHSHLMLLDRPSASTHNRGARGPFPAFPDCHPSMPMSLVEEELAPPPFPTESAFLPAFSCSFPGAAKH